MADGGGRPGRTLSYTVGLSSAQLEDRRAQERDESVQLSDSSSLAETRPSPLELRRRSYTEAGAEGPGDGATTISTLAEMESQRTREAKMRETAEQFVGAPVTPTVGEGEAPGAPGAPRKRELPSPEEEAEMEEEEEAAPDEGEIAQEFLAAQTGDVRLLKELEAQRAQQAEVEAANATQANRDQLKQTWDFVEGANIATFEDLVGAVVAVGMMDIQLVNKLTVRNFDQIPDLSIPQTAFITAINVNLCYQNCCSSCPGLFFIFLPFALLAAAAAAGIATLTSLFSG
jgi:hypothetical protein